MTTARKAFTTYNARTRLNYEDRTVHLLLTNGNGGLSLGLRYEDQFTGTGTNLTADQARELAAELTARADEIDANYEEDA